MAHGNPRTLLIALTTLLTLATGSASATTYFVTSLEPSGTGSLAAAITNANNHPGPDIIQVSVQGTVELDASGLPVVADAVTIQGSGVYALTIDGQHTGDPVFRADLSQGGVLISDLSVSQAANGAFEAYGAGTLVVERVSLTGHSPSRPLIEAHSGAGLSIYDSVIADNTMTGGDAAIAIAGGNVAVARTTIARNSSNGTAAGVSAANSDVTLDDVTFTANINTGNLTDASSGAFYGTGGTVNVSHSRFAGNEGYAGGALTVTSGATLSIEGSTFSENSAATDGGALRASGASTAVTILGSSFLLNDVGVDQTSGGGAISMTGSTGSAFSITDSLIFGNETPGQGGGISLESVPDVTFTRTVIAGNSAAQGGGLSVSSPDTFALTRSLIDGNTATQDGAGLLLRDGGVAASSPLVIEESTISENASSSGPAVFLEMTAASTIHISRSTFSGNTGTDYGAIEIGRGDGDTSPGSVTITNSTFSSNTATSTDTGILFGPHVAFTVEHATFVDNAGDAVSGVQVHAATKTSSGPQTPAFDLDRSVLVSSNAAEIRYGDSPYGPGSTELLTVSGDHNIAVQGEEVKTGASGSTSASTADPVLGALTDNGGYTQTHLPLAGSPAIDEAPDGVRPDSVDQRGVAADGDADLGAVEAIDNSAPELVGDFEKALSGWVGRSIDVDVAAQFSDPDGDSVVVDTDTVHGLPDGLTFDAGTGRITGSPAQAGSYNVTIEVRDDAAQPLSRVARATVVVAKASSVKVRKKSDGGAVGGFLIALAGLLLAYRRKR